MGENRYLEAVKLAKSGARESALDVFQQILESDPGNEMAWLWLVECLDTRQARILALEACVRLNPRARQARAGLAALKRSGQAAYPRIRVIAPSDSSPVIAVTGSAQRDTADPFNLPLQPLDDFEVQVGPGPQADYDPVFSADRLNGDVWGLAADDPVFTASPETVTPGEVAEREARVYDLLTYRRKDREPENPWEEIEQAGLRIARSPERVTRGAPTWAERYGPTEDERVLSMTYTSLAVFVVSLLVVLLLGSGRLMY